MRKFRTARRSTCPSSASPSRSGSWGRRWPWRGLRRDGARRRGDRSRRSHHLETVGGFLHAAIGGGGIKLARHFQILRHQRRRAGLVQFSQLELRHRMMGGRRGLEQRQGRAKIRRAGFTLEQHVGKIGLGGGKSRLRGAEKKFFR